MFIHILLFLTCFFQEYFLKIKLFLISQKDNGNNKNISLRISDEIIVGVFNFEENINHYDDFKSLLS